MSQWQYLEPKESDGGARPLHNAGSSLRSLARAILPSMLQVVLLLILCYPLFFHRLAERDLWSSHEARAAQDAQVMVSDGRWGLPRLFDRQVDLQKPPLFYWSVATIARLRGGNVDALAVRLPAAVGGLAGVLLVYGLGWRCGRSLAGFIAACVLATALHYTWLARVGRIDMPLTCVVTLSLTTFYLGQRCRREPGGSGAWHWFFLSYLALALGVLLKGPIGAVLPFAVAGVYLLLEGGRPAPWRVRGWLRLCHVFGAWWGLPLMLSLAVPWYLWADATTGGELFRVFFWKHNIERGLGSSDVFATHPWWFYLPRLTFDLLPWSPLVLICAWLVWRNGWWRIDAEARFGLCWLVTVFVFLSCLRFKRADYLLPAYPGAAVFLGCAAERCWQAARRRKALAITFGLVLTTCVGGWWYYLGTVLPRYEPLREYRRFATEIRRRAPAPQLVLFFRTEAHALAFHVGRQIDTLLEWENLEDWAARPDSYLVVMSPDAAQEWMRHLKAARLEEVLRSTDVAGGAHEHPLVLMRTLPDGEAASGW